MESIDTQHATWFSPITHGSPLGTLGILGTLGKAIWANWPNHQYLILPSLWSN